VQTLEPGDPAAVADEVATRFEQLHGRRPEGVFAAPGRVNLIGEHVDYNGGLCLPMALPHATYAAVGRRDDDTVTVTSSQQEEPFHGVLDRLGPGETTGWAAYSAGVVWALQQSGWTVPGMDVVVDSRVPLGAGLSSSAAIECAVALGITGLVDVPDGDDLRTALVRVCMRAEAEVAGAPTGGMDQTVALFARADAALLLDCRDWSTEQVRWDPAAAGLALLVVDTRASHALSDGGYEERRRDCEAAAEQLGVKLLRDVTDPERALAALTEERLRHRARHVFTEIARVEEAVSLIRTDDFEGLGSAMTASHASLRDDYEVSCPELDVVVDVSLAHDALGARMTGGGFGGSAIALLPATEVSRVGGSIEAAYRARGWRPPGFLTAVPSSGARRVR
jgi:galactokinase